MTDTDALVKRLRAWLPDDPGPHEPFGLLHSAADTIAAQAADMDAMAEAALRNEDFKQKQAARIAALEAKIKELES